MRVKNNYNECITNFACSIRKYFGLKNGHKTLEYIDKILEENKPKNVVTILFDGMGNNILERTIPRDSFFIKNKLKEITTVFPATTVAATTSVLTGLNPVESGMLGWNMYYKDINKTITTFLNIEKNDVKEKVLEDAIIYKKKHMKTKTIMDEINEQGKYKAYGLFPFGPDAYSDIDEMVNRIEKICSENGKKYIYAYDNEPDHSMHLLGSEDRQINDLILYRNNLIERLSKKLNDTIIFVIADHGHITVNNIELENYPDIVDCLEQNTSLEPRATNFFVKDNKKEEFKYLFHKYFLNDFDLYNKDDIIKSKLFGDGVENEIFKDLLGNFLAIAKTNKAILYKGDEKLKSQHAGYTDDEILIPLIVIKTSDRE